MGPNFRIDDGNGNEIADGLSETQAWKLAQEHANKRGEPVYVSSSDLLYDSVPVNPE